MLQEFVLISFASFVGWQIFRYFSFFSLNVRVAPIFALAISYGFTYLQTPSILIAFAATGGVALLNRITEATSPEPLRVPKIKKIPRRKKQESPAQDKIGHRIPMLNP